MNLRLAGLYRETNGLWAQYPATMLTATLIALFTLMCLALSARTWNTETSPERNELVFAERNQGYGAFRLRTDHGKHVAMAFMAAMCLLAATLVLPWALLRHAPGIPPAPNGTHIVSQVVDVVFPPPPAGAVPAPEQIAAPAPAPKAGPLTGPVEAAEKDSTATDLPPVDTSGTATASTLSPGKGTAAPDTGGQTLAGHGFGTDPGGTWDHAEVQEVPGFPGGEAAMRDWLRRQVEFPRDLDGKEVVYVQFVVGTDGTVEDVKVVKGDHTGCKASAVGAVRRMPRWKPARMNGQVVRCRLILPVRFEAL